MGKFLIDFRDGISAYGYALEIIREQRLWLYIWIPGLMSLLYGAAIISAAVTWSQPIADWIVSIYPFESGVDVVATISKFASWLVTGTIGFFLYKYVILVLVAPFMGPLSERVESYLRGGSTKSKLSFARVVREVVRGLRISLRNIVRELFFTIILLLAGLIPVVGLLSAPALFFLQAYYAGFGNMDYTMERHLGVRSSARLVRRNKGLAVGNGSVFLVVLAVPVVGLFFAPGLATVAGTVETVSRLAEDRLLAD